MMPNQETIFTLVTDQSPVTSYVVPRNEIGNLESFEIDYDFKPLEPGPLVSTSALYFQGKAMDIILDAYNKHRRTIFLLLQHPELTSALKYSIDLGSVVKELGYVECTLVMLTLYNQLADKKSEVYSVDLNMLNKYSIELPMTIGQNRIMYYGATWAPSEEFPEEITDFVQWTCGLAGRGIEIEPNSGGRKLPAFTVSTGWQPYPVSFYKSAIESGKDMFLTTTCVPEIDHSNTQIIEWQGANGTDYVPADFTGNVTHRNLYVAQPQAPDIYDMGGYHVVQRVEGRPTRSGLVQSTNLFNMACTSDKITSATIKIAAPDYHLAKIRALYRKFIQGPTGMTAGSTDTSKLRTRLSFYRVRRTEASEGLFSWEVRPDTYNDPIDLTELTLNFNFALTPVGQQFGLFPFGLANYSNTPGGPATLPESVNWDLHYEEGWMQCFRLEFRIDWTSMPNHTISGSLFLPDTTYIAQLGFFDLSIPPSSPVIIDVTYDAPFESSSTNVDAYVPRDLLAAGLKAMIHREQLAVSPPQLTLSNFGPSYYNDLLFIPVESYKNRMKRSYYFKLDDFIKTYIGLGYQVFSSENSMSFIRRSVVPIELITVDDCSDYTVEYSDVLLSTIELGYNLDETSTGALDPHRRSTFKSSVRHKAKTMSYILPYRADCLGLMKDLDASRNNNSTENEDKWWDAFLPVITNTKEEETATATGVFMLHTAFQTADTGYSSIDMMNRNMFNWWLSVPRLMGFMAKYLKYSGRHYELVSSYGKTSGSAGAGSDGLAFGPVVDLDYNLSDPLNSTSEKYGGQQLSTTVVLSIGQLDKIIRAQSALRNVHLRINSLNVQGLLLRAKFSLIHERAVDITMLVDGDYQGYKDPELYTGDAMIPSSVGVIKPLLTAPGSKASWSVYVNSPRPITEYMATLNYWVLGPVDLRSPQIALTPSLLAVPSNNRKYLDISIMWKEPADYAGEEPFVELVPGTYTLIIETEHPTSQESGFYAEHTFIIKNS